MRNIKKIASKLIKKIEPKKTFKDRWYKHEPTISIEVDRKNILKKRGFLASSDLIYDFNAFGYQNYINNRDYRKLHPINGSFSQLIDNKAYIPVLFKHEQDLLPEICISIDKGLINYSYGIKCIENNIDSLLVKLLENYQELFVKPVSSSGGRNTIILNKSNVLLVSKDLQSSQARVLINNRLINEKYSNIIYSGSINTIRVVFFKDLTGVHRIFRILHRFGTSESGCIDNCGAGGMVCSVDIENGVLSNAIIYASDTNNGWHDRHVDTGFVINGFKIPQWDNKLKSIKKTIENLDFLHYGGIDFAPTDNGLKILEINSLPELGLTQLKIPALIDKEFKQFIISKGYQVSYDE